MTAVTRDRVLTWLNATALGAWAVFLICVYLSGLVDRMLAPAFRPWTLFAGCGLVFMALAVLASLRERGPHACACAHAQAASPLGFLAQVAMRVALAVPIVLCAAVPMKGLSVAAVKKRGVRTIRLGAASPRAARQARPAPQPAARPPEVEALSDDEYEELSFPDLIDRATGPEGERAIEKLRVAMVGQYFREDDSPPNAFRLYRIRITCCLADAEVRALHVLTRKPFTPEMAGEDEDTAEADALVQEARTTGDAGGRRVAGLVTDLGGWLQVKGKLRVITDRGGYKALQLVADKIERTEAPVQKYMFAGDGADMGF